VFPSYSAWAWDSLQDGLWYRVETVNEHGAETHLLKIDLESYRLDILRAERHGVKRQTILEITGNHPIVAAVNASFFDLDGNELGLVVKNGQELSPLRRAAWGIFQIISGNPSIIHTREFDPKRRPSLAIQSGPRLLVSGVIPKFKRDVPSRRSGICVAPKKRVILAVATHMPITLNEFARSLKPHCKSALNLDGGSSTQFYLKAGKKELLFPGLQPVPNVLVVIKK
jgi:uncharacterized protein YigE (DUF2233 family)